MPQTSAERKKKYLESLKERGLYDFYKKKKALKAKERRDQIKRYLENLPKAVRDKTLRAHRDKNRERVNEYRRRKKLNEGDIRNKTTQYHTLQSQNSGKLEKPYKTASALWKAVAKVKQALPSSPIKKIAVVKKLLDSFDAKDQQAIINDILVKVEPTDVKDQLEIKVEPTEAIRSTIIDTFETFYETEDINSDSSNTEDCIHFVDPLTICNVEHECINRS